MSSIMFFENLVAPPNTYVTPVTPPPSRTQVRIAQQRFNEQVDMAERRSHEAGRRSGVKGEAGRGGVFFFQGGT